MVAARGRGNRRGETRRRARDVDDRPAIFGDSHLSAADLGKRWGLANRVPWLAGGGRTGTVTACRRPRSRAQ